MRTHKHLQAIPGRVSPAPKLPKDLVGIAGCSSSIVPLGSLTPEQFLTFAERDLSEGDDERGRVNALSNAKRSIDCQVERLLTALAHRPTRPGFPAKLERLEAAAISRPRILRKVNALRNQLEHDFALPPLEAVEDAIDVAELFLRSTNRILENFPTEILLAPRGVDILSDPLYILIYQQKAHAFTCGGIRVEATDPAYVHLVRLAVLVETRVDSPLASLPGWDAIASVLAMFGEPTRRIPVTSGSSVSM